MLVVCIYQGFGKGEKNITFIALVGIACNHNYEDIYPFSSVIYVLNYTLTAHVERPQVV